MKSMKVKLLKKLKTIKIVGHNPKQERILRLKASDGASRGTKNVRGLPKHEIAAAEFAGFVLGARHLNALGVQGGAVGNPGTKGGATKAVHQGEIHWRSRESVCLASTREVQGSSSRHSS
nr:hypothetical protein Iba_chr11eCG11780 [Ipomoea batatas]